MSLSLDEIYIISTEQAKPQEIIMRPKDANFQRKEPIVVMKTNSQPKWRLYEGSDKTYTIALAGDDNKRIFIDGKYISIEEGKSTNFVIEKAGPSQGEETYRIHNPGKDAVLKAGKDGEQVTVAKADGTDGER
ncbi:hypothetical protein ONZ45_g3745 [Pleurotus djamor]|nr:hypothetical protein ONZ45_g3745 [Pleurotus djamor]